MVVGISISHVTLRPNRNTNLQEIIRRVEQIQSLTAKRLKSWAILYRWGLWIKKNGGRMLVLVLCSRSAHNETVLARRPQLNQHGHPLKRINGVKSKEATRVVPCARRGRTVKLCSLDARSWGRSRPPPQKRAEKLKI